jgi:hypothetical protein
MWRQTKVYCGISVPHEANLSETQSDAQARKVMAAIERRNWNALFHRPDRLLAGKLQLPRFGPDFVLRFGQMVHFADNHRDGNSANYVAASVMRSGATASDLARYDGARPGYTLAPAGDAIIVDISASLIADTFIVKDPSKLDGSAFDMLIDAFQDADALPTIYRVKSEVKLIVRPPALIEFGDWDWQQRRVRQALDLHEKLKFQTKFVLG